MTPSQIPPRFSRQMGCTHEDMLRWLPTALPGADLDILPSEKTCLARWDWGILTLCCGHIYVHRSPRHLTLRGGKGNRAHIISDIASQGAQKGHHRIV